MSIPHIYEDSVARIKAAGNSAKRAFRKTLTKVRNVVIHRHVTRRVPDGGKAVPVLNEILLWCVGVAGVI